MAQQRIDKSSEAFKILQENLSSARDKDLSTDDVEKAIRGNKNLLKIYKEIEASLKKSTELYKQNRKSLEYINELNKNTFKVLKDDQVARKQINDLNRQNIKYLDETQNLVRESLKNDIDSSKIKDKINQLNNEIAKSERARFEQSDKIKESYEDVFHLIKKNENSFKLGTNGGITNLINEIKDLDTLGRTLFDKLSNAKNEIDKSEILAEISAIDQNFLPNL
jgi:DNA-binding transcriptional regulator GbsR (MarR family)